MIFPQFCRHFENGINLYHWRCSITKGKSYQRYPANFKKMALIKATEDGMSDARSCEELGISDRQLRRWRDEFRLQGDDAVAENILVQVSPISLFLDTVALWFEHLSLKIGYAN